MDLNPPNRLPLGQISQWFFQRLGLNRAVLYALTLRGWQLVAGAGTMVLMTIFFTKDVQGFYYTFASLVALQTFFELGFGIAIVNVCSHEWAQLRLDATGCIQGDRDAQSRLVSLGRLLARWYLVASLLFAVMVGVGGAVFLAQKSEVPVAWQQPWVMLVVLSGLLLWTLPFNALLEGCNQVATINLFRLVQAMAANLCVWIVMVLGGGLWAAVAAAAARLACDVYLLSVHYRRFFRPFFDPPRGAVMSWRDEVWPLQWRLAVQGSFAYLAFFLFTPLVFYYQGPVLAGQMGMTWTVATALQAAALAWVQTRVPRFGMLIQQGKYGELDRLFFRLAAVSVAAMIAAGSAFWLFLYGLHVIDHPAAERLLPLGTTAIFLLAVAVHLVASCQVFYVRAHKREPFAVVGVVDSLLVGLAVCLLGGWYSAWGMGIGLLAVRLLFTLPTHTYIWAKCRREWH